MRKKGFLYSENTSEIKPLRIIFDLFNENRKYYLIVIGLMILGRGLATAWPYFLKELVNSVSTEAHGISLKYPIVFFLFAYMLSELCLRLSAYINVKPVMKSIKCLKLRLFNQVMEHSTQFIFEQFSGKLAARVDQVCTSVESLIDMFLWVFFSIFINITVAVWLLFRSNMLIAVIFCLWFVCYLFFLKKIVVIGGSRWEEATNKEAQTSGKMVDIISNILAVKIFSGNSNKRHEDFEKTLNDSYEKIQKASYFSIHCYSFQELATTILGIMLLLSGYYLYRLGELNGGEIAMILSLFMLLKEKFHSLGSRSREFFKHYGKLKGSLKILSVIPDIQDIQEAKEISFEKVDIEFRDVSFSYPSGKKVFRGLNFKITGGEKIGVIGKSGSGKSTLINLLLRLYEIDSGYINFNDVSIVNFKQESLRKHITIVPQEPILFHCSIWDNIRFSNPEAKELEVMSAIELANCSEFIDNLPNKHNTIVGERGVKLSGGQRQRIAIARAILKEAPIIIFDEPTSALDSENEALIQSLFSYQFEDRTVIVFAHRLSTLSSLDRILILDNGKIKKEEDGKSFKNLLKNHLDLFSS